MSRCGLRRDGRNRLEPEGIGQGHPCRLFRNRPWNSDGIGYPFAHYNIWLVLFAVVTTLVLCLTPTFAHWFFKTFNGHVSEPEIKLLLFMLFGLGWLATRANSEAVLPAYLLGLVVAGLFKENREMVRHLRTATFALLTPFYFLKAGTIVSLSAIVTGFGLILILLGIKVAAKFIGVYPLTTVFRFSRRVGMYTTLLMSTGLTFGSISALFGYTRGIITQSQYTILVTVVIGSAVAPTLIAQWFFQPRQKDAFFEELNRETVEQAKRSGVRLIPHIVAGHEVESIVSFCEEGCFDLLVVGFMGHSRIFDRVWGSTSQTLTRLAPCAVLVVK
jgi:Kef-type K+ transport system membrane component KefB